MTNKIWRNSKFTLSIIGTIFGHPVIIVIGAFLTLTIQGYLNTKFSLDFNITQSTISIVIFPLVLVLLTFIRYCFFYFWNYWRIKHLSFIDGFKFFVDVQLYQIVFIPLYVYIYLIILNNLNGGGGFVVLLWILSLLVLSVFVFGYMIIRLYKYEKFDLKKEK